jgi:hypothetical protein
MGGGASKNAERAANQKPKVEAPVIVTTADIVREAEELGGFLRLFFLARHYLELGTHPASLPVL